MRRPRTYDVCSVAVTDLPFDARIWKQARTLAKGGRSVALMAPRYGISHGRRRRDGEIDVTEIPFGTRDNATVFVRAATLVRLWLQVLRTPAKVYHCHDVHPAPAAWLASRIQRGALVYDAHELYGETPHWAPLILQPLGARIGLALERFMVRRSSAVITTNESRAAELSRRHGRTDIIVLANVPRSVEEVVPLDPGYPRNRKILLYQGGIYAKERAFRETIAALAFLGEFDLVILGFGRPDALEMIRGWAREAGVLNRVHILPPRPFDELVATSAAATIGIVPLKPIDTNNVLGDTNKLFEYMMGGLPVVASDLPEIRRVLIQGSPRVGELFDPESPKSIARAIRKVTDDPDQYAARRHEARRLALERFNWDAEEGKLLGVYDRICGQGG